MHLTYFKYYLNRCFMHTLMLVFTIIKMHYKCFTFWFLNTLSDWKFFGFIQTERENLVEVLDCKGNLLEKDVMHRRRVCHECSLWAEVFPSLMARRRWTDTAGALHELHGWSGCYLDDVSVLGLLAPLQRHFGIPKLCFQKHRKSQKWTWNVVSVVRNSSVANLIQLWFRRSLIFKAYAIQQDWLLRPVEFSSSTIKHTEEANRCLLDH